MLIAVGGVGKLNRFSRIAFQDSRKHAPQRAPKAAFKVIGENIFIAKSQDSESASISISVAPLVSVMRAKHPPSVC